MMLSSPDNVALPLHLRSPLIRWSSRTIPLLLLSFTSPPIRLPRKKQLREVVLPEHSTLFPMVQALRVHPFPFLHVTFLPSPCTGWVALVVAGRRWRSFESRPL